MTAIRRDGDRGGVPTGIRRIHRKACPPCRCSSYEAWVWDARVGSKLRRTFRSEVEAEDMARRDGRGRLRVADDPCPRPDPGALAASERQAAAGAFDAL